MKLSKAAKYFNRTKFFDAYSGEELGTGQLDVFDESKRDGLTAQRRVFEVAPGAALPTRLTIQFHGLNWLVGVTEMDAFKGAVIREKHVLHQAEGMARVSTVKQLLEATDPHEAYAARVWVKSTSEAEISSGKFNQLQIFFSRAEHIPNNSIVDMGGRLHTIMASYPATAGHLAAVAEELDTGALEVGLIKKSAMDPVTEIETDVNIPITVLKLRWQSDFTYFSQASETFKRGDMQAVALTAPANGTRITLVEGNWTVISTQFRSDVHYLHLRRGAP